LHDYHFKLYQDKVVQHTRNIELDLFIDDITRDAATPVRPDLFDVPESEALEAERAENFHSVTAQLLFISRRCRLDIQTAVGFLTKRVSCPTVKDWSKLKRVLQYLRGTADDIRKIMGRCIVWSTLR